MKNQLGLRDIQGIDAIGLWPLAMGWWIVIGIIGAIALFVMTFIYLRKRKARWEFQLKLELDQMIKSVSTENAQSKSTELASLIRRLAIHRFSREECAHLQGQEWVAWLSKNDPTKYNWSQSSDILIRAPFQPPGLAIEIQTLKKALMAAKGWIK